MIWDDFGKSWRIQKLIKITKNRFRGAFGSRLELGDDFDSDFEAVFADSGWILEGFGGIFEGTFG